MRQIIKNLAIGYVFVAFLLIFTSEVAIAQIKSTSIVSDSIAIEEILNGNIGINNNTSNNTGPASAQVPMTRYIARRVAPDSRGLIHSGALTNERCDFFYPTGNSKFVSGLQSHDAYTKERAQFIWKGDCSNGLLQGNGKLGTEVLRKGDARDFSYQYENVSFSSGQQGGPMKVRGIDIKAKNFYAEDQLLIRRDCVETGFFTTCIRYREQPILFSGMIIDTDFDEKRLPSCGEHSGVSLETCKWAVSNESAAAQSASTFANRGDCVNLKKHVSDAWEKGRVNLNSYEATCESTAKFNTALSSKDAQSMFLAGTRYESAGERGRAKTIYNSIMNRFPKSNVAVNAGSRLAALSDVEAVEAAGNRAADASARAANSVRTQNYNQCMMELSSCRSACQGIKHFESRIACERRCPQFCPQ